MVIKNISKNLTFGISLLFLSCVNLSTPLPSNINDKFDIDKLYSDFKSKEKKEYEYLMKKKKDGKFDIQVSINTGLQKNDDSFSTKSLTKNIRKKTWILSREKDTKSNIFYPSKSLSELNLESYSGDILISNGFNKSSININSNSSLSFLSNVIIIEPKESSNLNYLYKKYNIKIIDSDKNVFRVKIDINKVDLSNLELLLYEYNKLMPENITNIEFSSIDSMKTFTVLLDIYINHKDLYNKVFLDNILIPTATKSTYYPNDFQFQDDTNETNINQYTNISNPNYTSYSRSWWLQETYIVNSWNYGIGTGIKIAHIDTQPFGLNKNIDAKKFDIDKRRLILDVENKQTGLWFQTVFTNDENEEHHGYSSIMTCCSERDNNISSVGSSPNALIMPYRVITSYDTANSIKTAYTKGANVISVNSLDFYNKYLHFISGYEYLEETIKDTAKKIPVVLSSGNWGFHVSGITPSRLSEMSSMDGIITVGGTSIIKNDTNNLTINASFNPNKGYCGNEPSISNIKDCNGKGSNYGSKLVWAPWENRYISAFKDPYKKEAFGGTSGAEPTVAGLVANMLSVNKDLSPSDIEDILYSTSVYGKTVEAHNFMLQSGYSDTKMIHGEKAIQKAIEKRQKGEKDPSKFTSKDFGIVKLNLTSSLTDDYKNNSSIGSVKFNDNTTKNILRTTSDYELNNANNNYVRLIGWNGELKDLSDDIEILSIKKENFPDPYIRSIELNNSQKNTIRNGTEIKIKGDNLYSFDKDIQIIFKDTTVTPSVDYYYNLNSNSVTRNKNATLLVFTVDFNKIKNSSGQSIQDKLNSFSSIKVDLAFKGISNKISNFISFDASNSFFISSLPSKISYNNQQIPVIENGTTTQVHKGDTIAIKIDPKWIDTEWNIGSRTIKLSEIIDQYAITKVPPDLPEYHQSLLIQYTLNGTGQDVSYEKALEILSYPDSFFYQGRNIPVVASGTNTMVTSGSKIAVPLPSDVKERLQNMAFRSEGKRYTYYDVVNEYAILGAPPNLSTARQDIIVQELSTGNTILTFEQALYKAALAMNLNPVTPIDALMIPNSELYPPFISDNIALSTHPGDIVAAALYGLSKNDNVTVTVDGQNMPIYDQRDGYLSFKIQGNMSGVYDVNINDLSDNVIYNKSLAILTHKLVFDSGRFGNQEIMIMDVDGANQTRLTNKQDTYNYSPDWDPSKTIIQYRELNNNDFIDIATIRFNGSDYKNLTNTPDIDELNVRFSYDGKKFVYTSNQKGNKDIWVMNIDGSNKINLTSNVTENDYNATWSPDGSKIAFTSEREGNPEIYIMDVDGSNQTRLTNNQLDDNTVKFSPRGDKLSYVSETKDNNTSQIWMMNPDGSSKEKLTDEDDYDNKWSPDGNKISYRVWKSSTNIELKIVDINTKQITTLTNNGKLNQQSNWLSDGSKLLFTSNISGGNEVYSINLEGSNLLRLTDNKFSDYNATGYAPREVFKVKGMREKENQRILNRRLKYQDTEFVKPIRIKK